MSIGGSRCYLIGQLCRHMWSILFQYTTRKKEREEDEESIRKRRMWMRGSRGDIHVLWELTDIGEFTILKDDEIHLIRKFNKLITESLGKV